MSLRNVCALRCMQLIVPEAYIKCMGTEVMMLYIADAYIQMSEH